MSALEYKTNPQTDFIQNPINILQQEKSSITTNPFVQPRLYTVQETLQETTKDTPKDTPPKDTPPKDTPPKPPTFYDINKKLSNSIMGLIDDLFEKPDDIPWLKYIQMILDKDERYTYLTVLFIFTTLFIILIN
jgi:hypothetical protein